MVHVLSEFIFAVLTLAAATYLIYNGRWFGLTLAFIGVNVARVQRLVAIVRRWFDPPDPAGEDGD